ncbi:MAG: GIY-YIG nuclease family protein [Candidatus Gottesmanbacteria bacterium]|nr:GIY-YIG nuclease family protein [Candidatus Gottesmanbacteria bacterium]
MWYVYILRCADNTLYTGVTTDIQRRMGEHNRKQLGAKYTRAKRPVTLVYKEEAADRGSALKREWTIKKLSKQQKENLTKT